MVSLNTVQLDTMLCPQSPDFELLLVISEHLKEFDMQWLFPCIHSFHRSTYVSIKDLVCTLTLKYAHKLNHLSLKLM